MKVSRIIKVTRIFKIKHNNIKRYRQKEKEMMEIQRD